MSYMDTIPGIDQLHCPWADEWDALAMIGRAERISDMLREHSGTQSFGIGTTIPDMNGIPRHSSFGTRYVADDGGFVGISRGLTKEARASTDDLVLELSPSDGPRLGIVLRIPAACDTPRPGIAEISAMRNGLDLLGRRLRGESGRSDTTASRQRATTAALATLLAHRRSGSATRAVRITTSLDGTPASIEISTTGQGVPMRLDPVSEKIVLGGLVPSGTLHLETHGGGKGKTYRSHALKVVTPIPAQRPDAVTTMRLIGELGLPDIPDYAKERGR